LRRIDDAPAADDEIVVGREQRPRRENGRDGAGDSVQTRSDDSSRSGRLR